MSFDAQQFAADLPNLPGVYQMFDADNQVIYVGKARSLKNRVSSYFNGTAKDNKTMALVGKVANMRYHITQSEGDALILENQLIKKHKPKYNILLKQRADATKADAAGHHQNDARNPDQCAGTIGPTCIGITHQGDQHTGDKDRAAAR